MAGMYWGTGWDHPTYEGGLDTFSGFSGSTQGNPSEFGWTQLPNGNWSRGNQTMTAGEMASQLPRWQYIKSQSTNAPTSGVNYLDTIKNYLGNQTNEYESSLKSLMANPDSIKDSAAYKFSFDQGKDAVERSAAAKGMLGSGNVLAELAKFGQGLASQQYNTEANRLAGLATTKSNSLLSQGQLALGAAKAQGDDFWNGQQAKNYFALNSGYGKQNVW